VRRGGAGVLGTSRRVTSPWPTVHRLVVTQYRTRPIGKRTRNVMKTSGRIIIIVRCVLSIVADMKYVEATWLAA
jgi:hypothetical protein